MAWHGTVSPAVDSKEEKVSTQRGAPSLPPPRHRGEQGANLTPPPLLPSLKASKKPGYSTGPRRWTEGSGSGKNIPVSPATGDRSPAGWRGCAIPLCDPCSAPQEELELLLDSAGRGNPHLLQGLQALGCQRLGESPSGLRVGQLPWDGTRTRGTGPAPTGLGQNPWVRARTHRMRPTRVG